MLQTGRPQSMSPGHGCCAALCCTVLCCTVLCCAVTMTTRKVHGALRYTEAYEREWRQKEKAAREHVAATNRDLAQARAAQQAARVAAQADMARLEAQEFHRIVEENRHSEQQQLEKVCQTHTHHLVHFHHNIALSQAKQHAALLVAC